MTDDNVLQPYMGKKILELKKLVEVEVHLDFLYMLWLCYGYMEPEYSLAREGKLHFFCSSWSKETVTCYSDKESRFK